MSHSTGYFELQLLSVENPGGQLLNGDCCDSEKSASEGDCGTDECDTYFRVCVKEYQTEVTTTGLCTYGSETTKVIGGNTFQFRGQKGGTSRNNEAGKIIVPFDFAWPVSLALSHFITKGTNLDGSKIQSLVLVFGSCPLLVKRQRQLVVGLDGSVGLNGPTDLRTTVISLLLWWPHSH